MGDKIMNRKNKKTDGWIVESYDTEKDVVNGKPSGRYITKGKKEEDALQKASDELADAKVVESIGRRVMVDSGLFEKGKTLRKLG
jgi:hypothetical protein